MGIFIIAFLGGVAGAVAKHFLAFFGKRAERQIATNDLLENLAVEALNEIRELAVEYWGKDECEELRATSARIVALCDSLPDLYVQLFEGKLEVTRQLDVQLNRLSGVVTGGKFQQADRKSDTRVIAEMETQLMVLVVDIRLNRARMPYPWI